MLKRVAVIVAAAFLLSSPASSEAATKSRRKAPPRQPPPVGSESRKIETPAPSPVPDNVPLPADNGIRARLSDASVPLESPPPVAAAPENAAAPTTPPGNDAEYNRRLLSQAIRAGILKEGASPAALTPEVLNRMIDYHVMKDAIRHGLLPANAVPSQVTPEVRAAMKKGGYFIQYYPDGSVNKNYGGK